MPAKKIIRPAIFILTFLFSLFAFAFNAYATGTISGTVKGPHGETTTVNYTFTQGATQVTGTTNSSGVFSQTLDNGDWSLTFTPPASFTYADNITIPRLRIEDGDDFNLGVIQFYFQEGDGVDELDEFGTLPSECSQTGDPVIIRAYYTDETKGSFLYAGRDAGITVVADGTDYTVTVDYSFLEGTYSFGTNVEAAPHQVNGTYVATHTIQLAEEGGGFPLISVTDTSNSTTRTCLQPGPVNLDIRDFLTGSDTTNFLTVSDFRAIQNFTMHVDGIVKIVFSNNTVNMLDPTVQRFMKSIGDRMISSKGNVSLDARAVLELKNAGATITWYGLTNYNAVPTILLDGTTAGSAVSGVTFDATTGVLTFDGSHFSEYTAVPIVTVNSPKGGSILQESRGNVQGNVNDPDATISITVNGVDQGTVSVDSSGNFDHEIAFTQNSNTIVVDAENSIGSALDQTITVTVEDPDVILEWPPANHQATQNIVTVKGSVSDPRATVTIKVNGRNQSTVTVDSNGNFKKDIEVDEYENTVTVDASNDVGEAIQRRLTVYNVSASQVATGTVTVLPQTGIPYPYYYLSLISTILGIVLLSAGLILQKSS